MPHRLKLEHEESTSGAKGSPDWQKPLHARNSVCEAMAGKSQIQRLLSRCWISSGHRHSDRGTNCRTGLPTVSLQSRFEPPSVKIKHGQHIRSEISFKVTYRGCLASAHPAKHIEEGAVHTFLDLSGTVAHVNLCRDLALHSALTLLLRLLKELGIVRAGCPLVSGVVGCICQAVCRGRGDLTFPS